MAVDLKHSRHSIGRTTDDHFNDLSNLLQNHSVSAHRRGLPLSFDQRATLEQPTVGSIGTSGHTLQGTAIFPGARQPRASTHGENNKPSATGIESVDAIYQKSKAHQHQDDQQRRYQRGVDSTSLDDEEPPTPPLKDTPKQSEEEESSDPEYASSLSRPDSAYTFTRSSFTVQLAELTALNLPEASSLTSSISENQIAPAAAKALGEAAGQLQSWIKNATEILGELDAEDDVEWAAAGGREGLEGVEGVAAGFDELVGVYVAAIDGLQLKEDSSVVPREELEMVVEQMERTMTNWKTAREVIKGIKEQVELAMEWEELWGVVLGDIGQEVDALNRIVFEMEEKRHRVPKAEASEQGNGFDIAELETIIEETQIGGGDLTNHRFSLPHAFAAISPTNAPGSISAEDESVIMGLFARMQPLRASLDFLPMTLSGFQARAKSTFPTACRELESRRLKLEMKWVTLGKDAETLHCELGEDRWVVVFRNAGRQATKMCESVERSVDKLQEAIDTGAQHSNPPALAKKVDNYEAKKMHYGPAIQRVLAIIEKGVKDRLTVNGAILKLRAEMQSRWSALEASMRNMDISLDDLNLKKSQQLRDSLSSIISMDRSAAGSAYDTPRSSPASSVVMGPTDGNRADPLTPSTKANSRRNSFLNSTASRPGTGKRHFSMPPGSAGSSSIPRKTTTPRSSVSSQFATPPSGLKNSSTFPTPTTRSPRPIITTIDGRPRWTSSGNMSGSVVGHNSKASSPTTPSPYRRTTNPLSRPPSSASKSYIPLPSPLSREDTTSPKITTPTSGAALPRAVRRLSGAPSHSSLILRDDKPSPSPAHTHTSRDSLDFSMRPKLNNKASASFSYSPPTSTNTRRQSATITPAEAGRALDTQGNGQAAAPDVKSMRPSTAMAAGRRSSMLPLPKARAVSGRDSVMGTSMASGAGAPVQKGGVNGEERRWR